MTESLFTGQTPTQNNAGPDGPITLATTMLFGVDGTITHGRFFAPVTVAGTYEAVVWEITGEDQASPSGTILGTVTFGALTPNSWNTIAFATPIPVVSTKAYRIGVRSSVGRYTATPSTFTAPIVNGNLTGVQNLFLNVGKGSFLNGTFATDITSYPTQAFNAANYFVDVVFEAGGGGGPTTVTSDLDLRWNVVAGVTSDLDLRWDVLADSHAGPPAAYDLNAVFDALAATWTGLTTGATFNGRVESLVCYSEVVGQVNVPAIVLELDDLDWDLNFGDGADAFTIVATVLLKTQDTKGAQRFLRTFLSRSPGAGVAKLKRALKENQTLSGLVSYAHLTTVRRVGLINYDSVDYQGAELVIEVIS